MIWLGSVLILVNSFFGLMKITEGWPFACYPTFDFIAGPEKNVFTMEVLDASGRVLPVPEEKIRGRFHPEKFRRLLSHIFSIQDSSLRNKTLALLWKFMARDNPKLKEARAIRFYENTLATSPEHWKENPIRRQLVFEMEV